MDSHMRLAPPPKAFRVAGIVYLKLLREIVSMRSDEAASLFAGTRGAEPIGPTAAQEQQPRRGGFTGSPMMQLRDEEVDGFFPDLVLVLFNACDGSCVFVNGK